MSATGATIDAGAAAGRRAALVVIGNFDGVHRGHQAVLRDAAAEAARLGLAPMVLTFEPHPAKVLGRVAPPMLTTLARKVELVRRVSPDLSVVVERFDARFASQTPEAFARDTLVGRHAARAVVVGKNFRFGKGRAGDFAELERLGRTLGFETRSHALVGDEHGPWSSTRIREAIARGDLDEAAAMLGRPHMVSGTVVPGARRGRTLGFPTCNLAGIEEMLPPLGVYAVLVDRELESETEERGPDGGASATEGAAGGPAAAGGRAIALAHGVANLGIRPTIAGADAAAAPTLEVHLFDRNEDLYGARLRVHFVARLRAERRFAGLDALKEQIARDAEQARSLLAGAAPDPMAGGAWR